MALVRFGCVNAILPTDTVLPTIKTRGILSKLYLMGVSLLCLQLLAQPSMAQNTATAYADDHTAQTMIVAGSVGKAVGGDTLAPIGEILHEFGNATDNTKASNANTNASTTKIITSHQSEIAHDKLVLNSPVIDEARILSADEITQLSTQIRQIYDDNLAQMALVIVPTTGAWIFLIMGYKWHGGGGLGETILTMAC